MDAPKPHAPKTQPALPDGVRRERSVGIVVPHQKTSRCTRPRTQPLGWIYYSGPDGSISDEILEHTEPLKEFVRELAIAQIGETLEMASKGQLEDGEDIRPVSIDPEMWEIRVRFNDRIYRIYYAEPATHPDHLIALRFHEKLVLGSQAEIDEAQDGEIAIAALRYRAGEQSNWGHAA